MGFAFAGQDCVADLDLFPGLPVVNQALAARDDKQLILFFMLMQTDAGTGRQYQA